MTSSVIRAISSSPIVYNSYRFNATNTARVGTAGENRGALTSDGKLGFDCSGFVYYVLKNSGYQVDYLSTSQSMSSAGVLSAAAAQWQTKIDPTQAQAGDLVYFKGHVGIVVSFDSEKGTGVFRSSTTSKGVNDEPFSTGGSSYWGRGDKAFEGFTRVTAAQDSQQNIWSDTDFTKYPPLQATPSISSQKDGSIWLQTMGTWEATSGTKLYGDYAQVNPKTGALGRYQLTPNSALLELGYTDSQGNWLGKEVNGVRITSKEALLKNEAAQDAIAAQYLAVLKNELKANGAWEYVDKVVGGQLVTAEGLLAVGAD